MSTTPRILVLILANDGDPLYCGFQVLWRQYMNLNPNIKAYFYKGHPDITGDFLSDENTLLIKIHDTLDTCYEKTLRAFSFFSDELHNYDFVFRTNLSSFVYFPHYLEFCKTLPTQECCCAYIGVRSEDGLKFPAGTGITLSIDLVKRLVEDKQPLEVQDDVTIGRALERWGISIYPCNRIDILIEEQLPIIDMIPVSDTNYFHYRLKNMEQNRMVDIVAFNKLLQKYYINS
jgi:hypothetical protein